MFLLSTVLADLGKARLAIDFGLGQFCANSTWCHLMGDKQRQLLLESATVVENNQAILQASSDEKFRSEFLLSEHLFGQRSMSCKQAGSKGNEVGEVNFTESWFGLPKLNSSRMDEGGNLLRSSTGAINTGFGRYWNEFQLNTADGQGKPLHSTKGAFSRGFFSDDLDTTTTDVGGNVIQTSHSTISRGWLFAGSTIKSEYKDALGNPKGESLTSIYNDTGRGPWFEGCGLVVAGLSLASVRLTGSWRVAGIGAAIGLGISGVGYIWPRPSSKTTYSTF